MNDTLISVGAGILAVLITLPVIHNLRRAAFIVSRMKMGYSYRAARAIWKMRHGLGH